MPSWSGATGGPLAGGTGTGGTNSLVPTSAVAPFGYYTTLLISSTSLADSPTAAGWSQVALSGSPSTLLLGTNYITAGSMNAIGGGAAGWAVNGYGAGATPYIMLVGWSASLGNNWAAVEAQAASESWLAPGYFGFSQVGQITLGPVGGPATSIYGASATGTGIVMDTVPEPGTMALAGLGGLAFMLLRRRK